MDAAGESKLCPKCGYERKPADTAPDWQCPHCGIVYAKFAPPAEIPDTVTEFQVRRSRTWREIRYWVLTAVACAAVLWFCEDVVAEPTRHFWMCLTAFVILATSIGRVSFIVQRLYRCPNCGEVPEVINAGVLINPSACPKCGVRLR